MASKGKRIIFSLNSINISQINETYNMDISFDDENQPKIKTTKLVDLEKNTVNKNTETFTFLDESKKTHKCLLSMIDVKSRVNVKELNYSCFWDRNPIDCEPIGCPVNYIPKQIQKTFFSQVSKDTYFIRENIPSEHKIEDDSSIIILNDDYYETEGAFCSFECCLSFILDNKHNRMYDMSHMLLTKIYNKLNNTKAVTITPAPNWRVLKEYGGHISISKFRSNFGKIDYDYSGYTQKCLPIAYLYEEKVKFF
jgi:hypothetical protein